jgi:branched-chain amino acid transport system permease protein
LLGVAIAVGAVVCTYVVLRSRLGLALQSIRDDERGAAGLGVDVYRSRFIVYLIAAGFTALAAGVHYLQILRVQPETAFSVSEWTAPIIVMVVVGGLGTVEGPILGVLIWYFAKDYFTDPSNRFNVSTEVYFIISGLAAMVFGLYFQRGIWGAVLARFPQLQLFPVRRKVSGTIEEGDERGD